MNLFCRLLGHTWIYQAENPKIRWATNEKTMAELEMTAEDQDPKAHLLCVRCAARIEDPSPDEVRRRVG